MRLGHVLTLQEVLKIIRLNYVGEERVICAIESVYDTHSVVLPKSYSGRKRLVCHLRNVRLINGMFAIFSCVWLQWCLIREFSRDLKLCASIRSIIDTQLR